MLYRFGQYEVQAVQDDHLTYPLELRLLSESRPAEQAIRRFPLHVSLDDIVPRNRRKVDLQILQEGSHPFCTDIRGAMLLLVMLEYSQIKSNVILAILTVVAS